MKLILCRNEGEMNDNGGGSETEMEGNCCGSDAFGNEADMKPKSSQGGEQEAIVRRKGSRNERDGKGCEGNEADMT